MNPIIDQLTFGTCRVRGPRARLLVERALARGIRRVDTAQLYRNEAEVFEAVRSFEAAHPGASVHVTSKLRRNLAFAETVTQVEATAERLGRPLDAMLLHRPLPHGMWRALDACVERGLVREIGVSNYGVDRLSALLGITRPLGEKTASGARRPVVLQTEVHPFVGPLHRLLSYCRGQGIAVQGHTILARGEYLGFPPLVRLAERYGVSPAILMLQWARQLGVGILFHTACPDHLEEVCAQLGTCVVTPPDMAEITGYHCLTSKRFIAVPHAPLPDPSLDAIEDETIYVSEVAARLRADREALSRGAPVSHTATTLPHRTHREILTQPLAQRIAEALFPVAGGSSAASHQRYRELLRRLRRAASPRTKRSCCAIVADEPSQILVAGRPVAHAIAYPQAMPVEVAPREELQPFFEFLAQPDRFARASGWSGPFTFPRGTFFPDQRMDLCKQVVGPPHVGALADAILAQGGALHGVRHFLLGNNIACDGDDPNAAAALAKLARDPALPIETWYLAGNGIGPRAMAVLADALAVDSHARALWLKRNPLGPGGARALGRLLSITSSLELLDLHNTGLFDEGMDALAEEAAAAVRVQHLYLSANALTGAGVAALGRMLSRPAHLRSLYLSMNRLGAEGLRGLMALLRSGALAELRRLDLGSNGLVGADLAELPGALREGCPRLRFLDLGTYLATRDLGEQANRLAGATSLLLELLALPGLAVLGLASTGLSAEDEVALKAAGRPKQSLLGVAAAALAHPPAELQRLRQPKRVDHIASVYRGRA